MATTLIDLFKDPSILREANEEFNKRTKDIKWYSPFPEDRPAPKLEPLSKEHYKNVIEAFKGGPKWEGWEPELSGRMKKITQEVLDELS